MKKVIALTLIMVLFSSICMAYTPNPDIWFHVHSYPDGELYFEKQINRSDENIRKVWILWIDTKKNIRTMQQLSIKKNKTYTILEIVLYDNKTNELISSQSFSKPYEVIIPETIADIACFFAFPQEYQIGD